MQLFWPPALWYFPDGQLKQEKREYEKVPTGHSMQLFRLGEESSSAKKKCPVGHPLQDVLASLVAK
jgi:hypothetical protein